MTKPDHMTISPTGAQFTPHPEGQFAMTCVDCVDLGSRVNQKFAKVSPTLALVFQSGEVNEEGRLHEVTKEFTASLHPKSKLREFITSWRGKSYTDKELQGFDPAKLVGKSALVTVEHGTSTLGRTYANINSIASLPKAMAAPDLPAVYERPAFFTEKIARYAAQVAEFQASQRTGQTPLTTRGFDEKPAALDDDGDDSLPW